MENLKDNVLTVGNTQFYIDALISGNWTKTKFIDTYKGKLTHDIDLVWDMIEKAIYLYNGGTKTVDTSGEEPKPKRSVKRNHKK